MTNRTYTQAEADALILIRRLITAAKKDCPQGCIPTIEVDELEQALTPDAARLALEPFNQRMWDLIRHQRSELHDAELITDDEYAKLAEDHPAVARLEDYDKAIAAHGAKLIADTREAEFDRVLDFLDESIDEDAGMDHWAARAYQAVAAHRAAIQEGKNV